MMDGNNETFVGFSENYLTQTRIEVGKKLSGLNVATNKLEIRQSRSIDDSQSVTLSCSSIRRPTNRFLKHSESLLSPGNVNTVKIPDDNTVVDCEPSLLPANVTIPAEAEQTVSRSSTVGERQTSGSRLPAANVREQILPVQSSVAETGAIIPARRVNKFLKTTPTKQFQEDVSKVEIIHQSPLNGFAVTACHATKHPSLENEPAQSDNTSTSEDSTAMNSTVPDSNIESTVVKLETKKAKTLTAQNKVPSPPTKKATAHCNSNSEDVEMPILSKEQRPEQKTLQVSKPSPAKRSASTSELGFLTGQTTRSKRTIVPNKRFFSTDSPPVLSKQEFVASKTPKSSTSKQALSENVTKKTTVINGGREPVTKKRSLSGGSLAKKRKLSSETLTKAESSIEIQKPLRTNSTDGQARPRRTIIPNRKFLSDEPPKEVSPKKLEIVEPNRKRRLSEKVTHNRHNLLNKQELSPDLPRLNQRETDEAVKGSDGAIVIVESHSVDVSNGEARQNEQVKAESQEDIIGGLQERQHSNGAVIEMTNRINEAELFLDEAAVKSFKENPIYFGACIVETAEQRTIHVNEAIICCGVCGTVKKYSTVTNKRKRGSFLCSDCVITVNKIFQTALKAKPFSCIFGPPVCEGSCHLVFNPTDQFCQACFAKACLKNLPMKDDVYFKIWRSIPPMSRGCVPTTPVLNKYSPNVGKVVCINEKGEIQSSTTSLKLFGGKHLTTNGVDSDAGSEDSNDSRLDEGLNSARIATFPHRTESSTNCENTIPIKNSLESVQNQDMKSYGVPNEEILLDRQTGQQRVTALVDPILKADFEDVEIFGFPVVVSGSNYPRKPLCFLCGSAGIEQLIFCSMCCEPFHPYCAGDELLMDTYVARYNSPEDSLSSRSSHSPDSDYDEPEREMARRTLSSPKQEESSCNVGSSKIILQWTCRRCMVCRGCGNCIGSDTLIRCSRCRLPYHLKTCIDKKFLNKIKDVDELRRIWTCDACLKCKSCGRMIESNRKLQAIQVPEMGDAVTETYETNQMGNFIMLCQSCFKQRMKGSYCPICEVCYDDNDWDSKMMECCKCNRWIHSTCEKLTDEQYTILGKLPEHIEYNCRLCEPVDNPPWYAAIQSHLIKDCCSALRLFEKKSLGDLRKKRSSMDIVKPSYVCSLFNVEEEEETGTLNKTNPESQDNVDHEEQSTPRLRENVRKTVSSKEMMTCKVRVRDFVKYPKTIQENWYANRIRGIEILNQFDSSFMANSTPKKDMGTPIRPTPVKCYTPAKHVITIAECVRQAMGTVKSVQLFKHLLITAVNDASDSDVEREVMLRHVNEVLAEAFPYFDSESVNAYASHDSIDENCKPSDNEHFNTQTTTCAADPFAEVFWDVTDFFDDRVCALCEEVGDFPPETCGRLLWAGLNEWIHCNCAIWSSEVWEFDNGALQQIGSALIRGRTLRCEVCSKKGATVSCCKGTCKRSYHLLCAMKEQCFLFEDKTMFCPHHKVTPEEQESVQHDMKVGRKVFVDLEWLQKRGVRASSDNIKLFVGSLKIDRLGNILPISVTQATWKDEGTTLLVPNDYQAQRVFWSPDNPWLKETYWFATSVTANGFTNRVHDLGINFVVDHGECTKFESKGLRNISEFHQWLAKAPKFFDEEFIEWLPPCPLKFSTEELDFSVRTTGDGNEPATSAFEIRKRSIPFSESKMSSSLKNCDDLDTRSLETLSTEGYSSSVDSFANSTPKSSRGTKIKRRRSSCKTKRSLRKRKTPPKKTLSPRRRSLRNLQQITNIECHERNQQGEEAAVSDCDSGVVDEVSSGGSCEGEKFHCRINLLSRFNDTLESSSSTIKFEYEAPEFSIHEFAKLEESSQVDVKYECEESKIQTAPFDYMQEDEEIVSQKHYAMLQYEVQRHKTPICVQSSDIISAWMQFFGAVSQARVVQNCKPLIHPTLGSVIAEKAVELANSYRSIGLSHRSVQYVLEQLPGISNVVGRHTFQYSHRPYVDVDNEDAPVSLNPTGCARSEGFTMRKPFDMFGWLASRHRKVSPNCHVSDETTRSQGLPLAMRFRDLGQKASRRFVVQHSHIHGRGLYARCDVEKGDMIIEYAGEVIRPSLTDPREKYYESKGIGCYMFRIKTQVIDATLKGNAARFINHSCEPNCEAKTVRILGKDHIIIFALRKIFKGEELTYDYKFEREEDKIPCTCGASRCRKYLN